ncbi:MAG: hypothetical protein WA628_06685 [Terriglobales bacterium]
MTVSLVFACGLTITLLAAFAVVRYLSGPLRTQLQELCGSAERAEFWTAFSNVTVVLTPAILAMLVDLPAGPGVPPLRAVVGQVRWGLIGLVGSVLMLGWILGRFLPRTPPSPAARPVTHQSIGAR